MPRRLKPTQCALWLRPPVPPEQRNFFYRGFNAVYGRFENVYARLIGRMVGAQRPHVSSIALIIIAVAGYGLARIPTGFLPIEDQGYVLAMRAIAGRRVAAAHRSACSIRSARLRGKIPAVDNVIAISGVSALDNNSTLANAGVAYVVLKDWSERGKGEDLRSLFQAFNRALAAIKEARVVVFPPPPIQGIGNAGGFAMQVRAARRQLRPGQAAVHHQHAGAGTPSRRARLQRVTTSFRSTVPQMKVDVDRAKAETLQVSIDDVFSTLSAYLGSSYVDQFNKFGRTFQVYVQADSQFRLRPQDIELLPVRNKQGSMIPLGTMVKITPIGRALAAEPLQPLSELDDHRAAGDRLQLRPGDDADGADGGEVAAAGDELRMDRHVLSGEARRQSDLLHLRAGDAAGLPGAGRAVRELVHAGRGAAGGAAVPAGAGRGAEGAAASTTISIPRSASCC